jgi:hypothetical protein
MSYFTDQPPLDGTQGRLSVYDVLDYLIQNSTIGSVGSAILAAQVDAMRQAGTVLPPDAVPLEITNSSVPEGIEGGMYYSTFVANGGTPPVTWTATGLPAGLSLTTAGALAGSPTTSGTSTVVVTATDSTVPTAEVAESTFSLTISAVA